MEMSQDSIKNSLVNTTTKLTDDLFRLLQVREKNEAMSKDWLLFITSTPKFSKLRPGEIYQAFKMALARELLDSKSEEINMLPELSINTTGKVLNAYLEWKTNCDALQLAKERLRIATTPVVEVDKEKIRNDFLLEVFEDIQSKGISSYGWLLFDDLKEKFSVSDQVKKRLYRLKMRQYLKELKSDVDNNRRQPHHVQLYNEIQKKSASGKFSGIVQNRCRSVVVCNYLRKFKTFVEFRKAIEVSKFQTEVDEF